MILSRIFTQNALKPATLWHNSPLQFLGSKLNHWKHLEMLDFIIDNAWAAEAPQQGGIMSLLPLFILFAVFWFFLIRPQMKQAKEHRTMVEALAKGDEIITNGGMLGKIKEIGDNFIVLEIAKEVQVKIQKNAVSATLPKGTIKTL